MKRHLQSKIYYHISSRLLTQLIPSIPDNYYTHKKEDSITPRISVAPSINQCIIGISDPLLGKKNAEFYVYEVDLSQYSCTTPSLKQVPDKQLTEEIWVLEPVAVNSLKKIQIQDADLLEIRVSKGRYTGWDFPYKEIN